MKSAFVYQVKSTDAVIGGQGTCNYSDVLCGFFPMQVSTGQRLIAVMVSLTT